MPEWLAAPGGEREVLWEGKVLKAILLVTGEADVDVLWNGAPVATVAPTETAVGVDVTGHVVEGKNRVALQSTGKVAALVELNGDVAKKAWLSTDAAWRSADGTTVSVLGRVDADPAVENPFDLGKAFDAYAQSFQNRPFLTANYDQRFLSDIGRS